MPPLASRIAAAAFAVLVVAGASPTAAKPTPGKRATAAARFIVSQQRPDGSFPALSTDPISWTADAVIALAAARQGDSAIERAFAFLLANSEEVDGIGEKAKVVLAHLATGSDPRSFAGRDLVQEILASQQPNGRYGSDTSVFSHSLAMLALQAADDRTSLDAGARWLLGAQCENGGWQFSDPPLPMEDEHCSLGYPDIDEANTDTTALAVQALEAMSPPATPERDPFAFFESLRDANGGWSYDRPSSLHSNFTSTATNTNSTALVLQAYAAAGVRPPAGSRFALANLQAPPCGEGGGSFWYTWADEDGDGVYERSGPSNLAATIAAVQGLLLQPLPETGPAVRGRADIKGCSADGS